MPPTLTDVTRAAVDLLPEDQLKLARILLDLSEGEIESSHELQDDWDKEIQRRLRELRSGKVRGIPLEQVRKKMEARFRS